MVRELLNGNQIGVLIQFNSGLPVNISANRDLNADGITSDRPLSVARNSLYLPVRNDADLRYTRSIPVRGSIRGEISEMKKRGQKSSNCGLPTVLWSTGWATRSARSRGPVRSRIRQAPNSASSSWGGCGLAARGLFSRDGASSLARQLSSRARRTRRSLAKEGTPGAN